MAKKFDLIVFDWDGTLFDSTRAIVRSIQASCKDLNLPVPSDFDAKQVIGLTLHEAMRRSVPGVSEEQAKTMAECYRRHYFTIDNEISAFDGVSEMLEALHGAGFQLAIATGKGRNGLERALDSCGFRHFFSASRCGDECFSKPHPQMLQELMEELFVEPDRTIMVGDTTHDLQLAMNAGVASLGVNYGAHTPDVLAKLSPLAQFDDVKTLSRWLLENA